MSLLDHARNWVRRNLTEPVQWHIFAALAAAWGADHLMPGGEQW